VRRNLPQARHNGASRALKPILRRADAVFVALPADKPTIDTCHACGKLFPRTRLQLCSTCSPVEEHRFQLVREFLDANEGAAVGEVSQRTGVSTADVRHFVEGGRLVSLSVGATCTCGGTGERCRFCRRQLATSFRDMEATMRREQADGAAPPGADEPGRTSYVRRVRRLGD
jgi:hypothetical protein